MKLKRISTYLLFVVLLVAVGLLYGFTSNRNNHKKIVEIHVDFGKRPPRFLTYSMVDKLLIQNQKSVKNQAKSKLDLYRLEKRVLSNPYVESASVYTTIDGKLFASVKERTPIARVLTDNVSYYLDRKGVKIPLSQHYAARVPLVTGVSEQDNVEDIQKLISYIDKDSFLKKEIIGIQKLPSQQYVLAVRSGDYKIEFGQLKRIDYKFKKLKAFYSKVLLDKTIYSYKSINLTFHNQVVGIK